MVDKNKIHYRIPLKLIASYAWASLNQSAKAILPVIGVHCNKNGISFPSIKRIAKLAGYKKDSSLYIGINDLIKNVLMTKEKKGRHNVYFLTDLALWKKGRSFFPFYKEAMILNYAWADLTPTEKALYIVLGEKAKINDPEVLDSNYHAIGNINKVCKYIKYAGISKPSFYTAYESLCNKEYIEFNQDEKYRYGIVNFSDHIRVDKNNSNYIYNKRTSTDIEIESKGDLRKALEIIARRNSNSDTKRPDIKKISILKVTPKTAYQKQVDFENKKKAMLELAEKLKLGYEKGDIEAIKKAGLEIK